jgi:hypothetical protein
MTTDEVDRRLRQLVREQAESAPAARDWDEILERAELGVRPRAGASARRMWAPIAAAVVLVAAGLLSGIVLTDRSGSLSIGERPVTSPPAATAPSDPPPTVPATATPGTSPPVVSPPVASTGVLRSIPYRLIIPGTPSGDVWTTSLATTEEELWALIDELGVVFEPPGPEVDFDTEVVIRFGLAESSSCRFDSLADLRFDPATGRLFPVMSLQDPTRNACRSDANSHTANSHTVVVAVERSALPEAAFDIWVDDADPPACCADGVTSVAAGQLLRPPTTTPDGRPVPEEYDVELPTGSVETGPEDLFLVHVDGDLWLHPGILGDAPGQPVRLADLGDPREPVTEGPGPNVVEEVAGVHDGAVLYSDCCEPAAGTLLAATGRDSDRIVWSFGSVPAMSPDGGRVAAANFAGLVVFDLEQQRARFRDFDEPEWFFHASDVTWSADGTGIWVLAFDVDGAFQVQRFDAESLEPSVPVAVDLTFDRSGDGRVAFAGRADTGEIVIAVTGGAAPHLRFLDPNTAVEQTERRRDLPDGTSWVRLARDGQSLLWLEEDELWVEQPGATGRWLGSGYTAAWFAG